MDPPRTTIYLQATTKAGAVAPMSNSDSTGTTGNQNSKPGGDQTILIHGAELWRNPKVFVGSQQADRVDVLPDMNGLLAHFNTVTYPPTESGEGSLASQALQTLTVVTSFGYDEAVGAVRILPPPEAGKAADSTFASLKTHYIVGGTANDLPIAINSSAVSLGSLSNLHLYMKRHGDPYNNYTLMSLPAQFAKDQINYTLPTGFQNTDNLKPTAGSAPQNGPYDLDLRIVSDPNTAEKSVLAGAPVAVAYLTGADQLSPSYSGAVTSNMLTVTKGKDIKLDVKFGIDPTLFALALPDWTQTAVQVSLTNIAAGSKPVFGTGTQDGTTVHITVPWDKLTPANNDKFKVTVTNADKSESFDVANPLTIQVTE